MTPEVLHWIGLPETIDSKEGLISGALSTLSTLPEPVRPVPASCSVYRALGTVWLGRSQRIWMESLF